MAASALAIEEVTVIQFTTQVQAIHNMVSTKHMQESLYFIYYRQVDSNLVTIIKVTW